MLFHGANDRNGADKRRQGGEETEEERRSPLENLKTGTPLNVAFFSGVETLSGVEHPCQAKTYQGVRQEPLSAVPPIKGQTDSRVDFYVLLPSDIIDATFTLVGLMITQPATVLYSFTSGR